MQRIRPLSVAALALAIIAAASAQTLDKDLQSGLKAISPAETYEIVKTLARPEYAGRLTGHPGYTAAAEWAAGKLESWGLKPLSGKDRFLQPYPSPYTVIDKAEMSVFLPDGKAEAGRGQFPWKPTKRV